MKIPILLVVLLGSLSCAPTALAQSPAGPTDESAAKNGPPAPVAFVYVARPTHLDAFAVAANGALTPTPGAPFANLRLAALVANQKYLVALDDSGTSLHTFAIESNGSLNPVSTLNVKTYLPCIAGYADQTMLSMNTTSADVYLVAEDCAYDNHLLSFKLESNGDLGFLGASNYVYSADTNFFSQPTFLSSDVYAYQVGCAYKDDTNEAQLTSYKRSSSGLLEFHEASNSPVPTPPASAGGIYCPIAATTGPSSHLAVVMGDVDNNGNYIGNTVLATYSANSQGVLTTKSTYENMPVVPDAWIAQALSISPSGKYLALAGDGIQIYHFNGSSPITHFVTAKLGAFFDEVAWDGSDHVYVHDPQNGNVHVFAVSSSGIKEAPGSPYSIPESTAITVVNR